MFDRRHFLRGLGESAAIVVGLLYGMPGRRARAAEAGLVAARPVTAADASALQAIMTACVRDGDSFFGKCGEWSRAWAEDLVTRCPDTVILASGAMPIAFLEIPPIRAAAAPLAPPATTSERQREADRRRNRTTLRVTAAGVRDDLLDREQSVAVFRALLHDAFRRARDMGYEAVEAVAPWEQHPRLRRKFTDYPGCRLVEPVSRSQEGGHDLYCLRWELDAAIAALAEEGAARSIEVSLAAPPVRG